MRRTAKSALAIALAASLIASGVGTSEAKAKKPTLSTTKVTITKGKTKKITVKKVKPAKTTWSVNKAGKKVVKLSSEKKTSVTIKGMKAGKATVTAKIKVGKKVYTKTVKVTVKNKAAVKPTAKPTAKPTSKPTATPTAEAPTATPTAEAPTATPDAGDATATPTAEAPTATPTAEAPTATPTATATATAPAQVSGMLDLSQAKKDIEGTPADYDAATGTVSAKGVPKLLIPLPEALAPGEEATFVVKGTKGGSELFRVYLDPGSDAALSDILYSDKNGNIGNGEFTWPFTLKNTKEVAATYIMFKGKNWETPIDDLTIKSIEFSKGQKEEPTATPKPTNKPGGGSGGSVSTTTDEKEIVAGKEYVIGFNGNQTDKVLKQEDLAEQFEKTVNVSEYLEKIEDITSTVEKSFMGAKITISYDSSKRPVIVENTGVGMELACEDVEVTGSVAEGYRVVLKKVKSTGSDDVLTVKQEQGKVTAVGTYNGKGCKFVTELTDGKTIKSFTYTTTDDDTDVLKVSKNADGSFTISVDSTWAEKNGFYIKEK